MSILPVKEDLAQLQPLTRWAQLKGAQHCIKVSHIQNILVFDRKLHDFYQNVNIIATSRGKARPFCYGEVLLTKMGTQ